MLSTLHWLPVEFEIQFKIVIISFKAIHRQPPVYLQELICQKEEKRYNLRLFARGIMLQMPRTLTKKTLGGRAFLAEVPKLWMGYHHKYEMSPILI